MSLLSALGNLIDIKKKIETFDVHYRQGTITLVKI